MSSSSSVHPYDAGGRSVTPADRFKDRRLSPASGGEDQSDTAGNEWPLSAQNNVAKK